MNTKRGRAAVPPFGALSRVGGLFGRQETKHARTTHSGHLGLVLGALAVVTAVSLVLVLRRRAVRRGSLTEESSEEAIEANEEA
jgi:hypothetical protein